MRKRWNGVKCPICSFPFKDDRCPHSVAEAEERWDTDQLYKEIMKRLKRDGVKL